jgi:prevent-host-death family protein
MSAQICLGQLRSHPGGYLDEVSAGRTLEVIRRGRLAALIVPESAFDNGPPASTIAMSSLRRNVASCFDRVADGDVIGVVRDGRPVARIVAAATEPGSRCFSAYRRDTRG